jgi:hypothetical protein
MVGGEILGRCQWGLGRSRWTSFIVHIDIRFGILLFRDRTWQLLYENMLVETPEQKKKDLLLDLGIFFLLLDREGAGVAGGVVTVEASFLMHAVLYL